MATRVELYGLSSTLAVGDQLKIGGAYYSIVSIKTNAADSTRRDYTLADPAASVITWKTTKRVTRNTSRGLLGGLLSATLP